MDLFKARLRYAPKEFKVLALGYVLCVNLGLWTSLGQVVLHVGWTPQDISDRYHGFDGSHVSAESRNAEGVVDSLKAGHGGSVDSPGSLAEQGAITAVANESLHGRSLEGTPEGEVALDLDKLEDANTSHSDAKALSTEDGTPSLDPAGSSSSVHASNNSTNANNKVTRASRPRMSIKMMTSLSHTHLLGMAAFFFGLIFLALLSEAPKRLKVMIAGGAWLAIALDQLGLWLTQATGARGALVAAMGGALLTLAVLAPSAVILWEIKAGRGAKL